jgi:hypothetical protein
MELGFPRSVEIIPDNAAGFMRPTPLAPRFCRWEPSSTTSSCSIIPNKMPVRSVDCVTERASLFEDITQTGNDTGPRIPFRTTSTAGNEMKKFSSPPLKAETSALQRPVPQGSGSLSRQSCSRFTQGTVWALLIMRHLSLASTENNVNTCTPCMQCMVQTPKDVFDQGSFQGSTEQSSFTHMYFNR